MAGAERVAAERRVVGEGGGVGDGERWRDSTGELVIGKVKTFEAVKAGDGGGDRAGEAVVVED